MTHASTRRTLPGAAGGFIPRPARLLPEGEHDGPPKGDPPKDAPKDQPPAGDPPKDDPKGYPSDTPLAEMTTDQQLAYWKAQSRKHENTVKARGDYDEIKTRAEKWAQYEASQQTPSEAAVSAAREEGRKAAADDANARMVQVILRTNLTARGRSDEDAAEMVAAVNPASFITDGDVDDAKIAAYATRFAGQPDTGNGRGGNGRWPDSGAGFRGGTKTTARERAAAEAEKRFGKKQ